MLRIIHYAAIGQQAFTKKIFDLGMQSPFAFDGVQANSAPIFRQKLTEHTKIVWAGIFPHAPLHLPELRSVYIMQAALVHPAEQDAC